jgi:hypothetical protein
MASKGYIKNEIDKIINSLKNDWSKWGDISESVREDTIKQLRKIKRRVK